MKLKREVLLITIFFLLLGPVISIHGKQVMNADETAVDAVTGPNGLVYSSFIGGSGDDYGCAVARDRQNNTIIAGITYSADFPVTEGAFDTTHNGASDVFVSKFAENGSLLFSTFIGGSDEETLNDGPDGFISHHLSLALDSTGTIVIYGRTYSADFPVTDGAHDTSYGGSGDLFIAKISSNGSELLFATYLGGTGTDQFGHAGGQIIATDQADNIIVTGMTDSIDFPTTPNAVDRSFPGVFIVKFSADGSTLLYSSFMGPGFSTNLVLDNEGNILVAGGGNEGYIVEPTAGAYDTSYNGGSHDGFILKLAADGSEILWTTLLGGSDQDIGLKIAVDSAGDVYVAGLTKSSNFPVTAGASDTALDGITDYFIAKLSKNGEELLFSTFHGGNGLEFITGMALDSNNGVYIAGTSDSADFPVTPTATDGSLGGGQDYTVSKLTPDGSFVQHASYLGGSDQEIGPFSPSGNRIKHLTTGDIELVSEDNVIVIGTTNSTDYPTTTGAYNATSAGGYDAFITQLAWTPSTVTTTTTSNSVPGFDVFAGVICILAVSTLVKWSRCRKKNKEYE
ncbi:MAG: SBBP repeat-containing protein [Candidatus Odinarchaeota archaeon]